MVIATIIADFCFVSFPFISKKKISHKFPRTHKKKNSNQRHYIIHCTASGRKKYFELEAANSDHVLEASSNLLIRRKPDRQRTQNNHQRVCRNDARQQGPEILPLHRELGAKIRNGSVHVNRRIPCHHSLQRNDCMFRYVGANSTVVLKMDFPRMTEVRTISAKSCC